MTSTGGNLCWKCNKSSADDQHCQHLGSTFEHNKCSAAHKLTKVLAGQSASKFSTDPPQSSYLAPSSCSENAMVWKDVHPKRKERNQPLTSKTLLQFSKNKKIDFPSLPRCRLSAPTQALKDTRSLAVLVTCVHSNILLPLPTLQKHEIKYLFLTSLKNARVKQESSHAEKGGREEAKVMTEAAFPLLYKAQRAYSTSLRSSVIVWLLVVLAWAEPGRGYPGSGGRTRHAMSEVTQPSAPLPCSNQERQAPSQLTGNSTCIQTSEPGGLQHSSTLPVALARFGAQRADARASC
ncbi:uncharacterized protein LOC136022136 [Lathamus discolor]|uniref:uncharacterized protein LOC136022136 n=1 Tax=Lathamus discolor TaxID=678569 RepID=UPI0032B857A1